MTDKIYSRRPGDTEPSEIAVEQNQMIQDLADNLSTWNYHLKQEDQLNEGDWSIASFNGNIPDTLDVNVTGFKGDFPEGYISENDYQGDTLYAFGALSNMPGDREIADRPIFIAEQILKDEDKAAVAGYVMHELGEHYNHQEEESLIQRKAVRNFDQILEYYEDTRENPDSFENAAQQLGVETSPDMLSPQELKDARDYSIKMGEAYGWL